jgi:hypothetical protein
MPEILPECVEVVLPCVQSRMEDIAPFSCGYYVFTPVGNIPGMNPGCIWTL